MILLHFGIYNHSEMRKHCFAIFDSGRLLIWFIYVNVLFSVATTSGNFPSSPLLAILLLFYLLLSRFYKTLNVIFQ